MTAQLKPALVPRSNRFSILVVGGLIVRATGQTSHVTWGMGLLITFKLAGLSLATALAGAIGISELVDLHTEDRTDRKLGYGAYGLPALLAALSIAIVSDWI